MKKTCIALVVMLSLALSLGTVFASDYPKRTITLIVPFNAGGGTDSVARGFVPQLSKELGVNVIVKNVGGAAGTLGSAEAAKARKDGYTLGFLPIGPVTTQPHMRKLPYDVSSFVPVANVTLSPVLLLTANNTPYNNLQDVIKDGKANPGKLVYGSSGPGTIPHIAMVATMDALGIKARHIPDKGTANAMKSMAGGVIQFFADTPVILERYDVKALGAYTDERLPGLPDVPTFKEQGVDLTFSIWRGVFAPKGTPKEIVDKIAAACEKAAASQEFKDYAKKLKTDILYMGPDQFAEFVNSEYQKNGKILESAGLKK